MPQLGFILHPVSKNVQDERIRVGGQKFLSEGVRERQVKGPDIQRRGIGQSAPLHPRSEKNAIGHGRNLRQIGHPLSSRSRSWPVEEVVKRPDFQARVLNHGRGRITGPRLKIRVGDQM